MCFGGNLRHPDQFFNLIFRWPHVKKAFSMNLERNSISASVVQLSFMISTLLQANEELFTISYLLSKPDLDPLSAAALLLDFRAAGLYRTVEDLKIENNYNTFFH